MARPTDRLIFKPINESHAIAEVAVFVQFEPLFARETLNGLMRLKDTLQKELPQYKELRVVQGTFNVNPEGAGGEWSQADGGFELNSVAKDGTTDWMLRVTENAVAIHCLDYTRWEGFWNTARNYLVAVFTHLDGTESFPTAMGLKVIDRFIYNGEPGAYDAGLLFNRDGDMIPKVVLQDSELWHSYTGWFDKPDDDNRTALNQINVSSVYSMIQGEQKLVTNIEHNAVIRPEDGQGRINIVLPTLDNHDDAFDRLMLQLHHKNKQAIANLLTPEICQQISLTVTNAA